MPHLCSSPPEASAIASNSSIFQLVKTNPSVSTPHSPLQKMRAFAGFRVYNSSNSAIYSASKKGLSLYVLCVYIQEFGGFTSHQS